MLNGHGYKHSKFVFWQFWMVKGSTFYIHPSTGRQLPLRQQPVPSANWSCKLKKWLNRNKTLHHSCCIHPKLHPYVECELRGPITAESLLNECFSLNALGEVMSTTLTFYWKSDIYCSFPSLCFVQPTWTHPTGNSLMFVGTTLANLASGPAWSSRWCHLLEPWWFTGSSCPTSSTTLGSLSTVSHSALVSTMKEVSHFLYSQAAHIIMTHIKTLGTLATVPSNELTLCNIADEH